MALEDVGKEEEEIKPLQPFTQEYEKKKRWTWP
jgi:hypothetical protein